MIFPVKNIQNFNLDIDYSVCENKYYSKSKSNQVVKSKKILQLNL